MTHLYGEKYSKIRGLAYDYSNYVKQCHVHIVYLQHLYCSEPHSAWLGTLAVVPPLWFLLPTPCLYTSCGPLDILWHHHHRIAAPASNSTAMGSNWLFCSTAFSLCDRRQQRYTLHCVTTTYVDNEMDN